METYRFTVRQNNKVKDFIIPRGTLEAEYGVPEKTSFLFFSAGSSGRVLEFGRKKNTYHKGRL